MSEILTAITLLMTVAMILYGLWHKEMVEACQIVPKKYRIDNETNRSKVWLLFATQALPLALLTGLTVIIFIPEALRILIHSLRAFQRHGLLALHQYSAVNTSFLLVEFAVAWLAWHAIALSRRLYRKFKKLGEGLEVLPASLPTDQHP
jgi:hypothetical protein